MLERPHDYVPLDNWAQKLNVDKRTLHRLFVRQTGMSYRNWLQQAHLLLALEWLADGQKVIDVAAGLGYNSQSAFTVMFRRNRGGLTRSDSILRFLSGTSEAIMLPI